MPHVTAGAAVATALALAGGGMVLAACGGHPATARAGSASSPGARASTGTTSPPATSAPAPAAGAGQPCTGAQLALGVQGPTGAAGEILYTLVLRNTASVACTLEGYPQVVLTGSGGLTVGRPLGDQPGTTPQLVTVPAGGRATATTALHDPSVYGCPTATATAVQVVPPGGAGPAASAALAPPTAVCTGPAPGAVGSDATVTPGTVGPVQPGI